jgi:hypothetical protein
VSERRLDVESTSLRELLAEWTDWDFASYSLAICLGLMKSAPAFGRSKHVFWSNHPIGDLLLGMLNSMTIAGVLERRDEPDIQFRWNAAFKGSWDVV